MLSKRFLFNYMDVLMKRTSQRIVSIQILSKILVSQRSENQLTGHGPPCSLFLGGNRELVGVSVAKGGLPGTPHIPDLTFAIMKKCGTWSFYKPFCDASKNKQVIGSALPPSLPSPALSEVRKEKKSTESHKKRDVAEGGDRQVVAFRTINTLSRGPVAALVPAEDCVREGLWGL
jgi:hypothetical protein